VGDIVVLVLRLAVRTIVRQRRLSALALTSVALSVTLMIALLGFVNGLEKLVVDTVVHRTTGALQIHRQGFVQNVRGSPFRFMFPLTEQTRAIVENTPGVSAAAGRIVFAASLSLGEQSVLTPIIAVDPLREPRVCADGKLGLASGRVVEQGGLVLSPDLARRFLQPGPLTALAEDADGVLNALDVNRVGTLTDIPLLFTNKRLAYMALSDAQSLLRADDRVLEIAVSVNDEVTQVAERLRTRLPAGFEVHTWMELNPGLMANLRQRRGIFQFMTHVFLLLALIGVTNLMLMSVIGREREIGTMMALGARRRLIAQLFLCEALLLGLCGGLIGVSSGAAIVAWFYVHGFVVDIPGTSVPFRIYPSVSAADCALPFALVVVGVTLASLYSAIKATRLDPVTALASAA
jgi:putative ABC transport system permease protein